MNQQYKCPKCGKPMHRSGTRNGRQRWICEKQRNGSNGYAPGGKTYCYATLHPGTKAPRAHNGTEQTPHKEFRPELLGLGDGDYIITAAQDCTPVDPRVWKSLLQARKHYNARLIVGMYRYKNPTTRWHASTEEQRKSEWWPREIEPYMCNVRLMLNKNISFLGDVFTQPTAESPLSGLEGFTGTESTIVCHPKVQLKTVATPGDKMAKLMVTTGSVSKLNYSVSKAGAKGRFHHSFGAVLVHVRGPLFWIAQLKADKSGNIIDRDIRITPKGVKKAPRPLALVLGDVHRAVKDDEVDAARFGPGGVVERYKPRAIVSHDTHDGLAENPHEFMDPFAQYAKHKSGANLVEREVREDIKWIRARKPPFAKFYIVASNHDDFLRRWALRTDFRDDLPNSEFLLETQLMMMRGAHMNPGGASYPSPFKYWVDKYRIPGVKCLGLGESLRFAGVEAGMHGDNGPNGARGTLKNLSRIGVKNVHGHGHGPGEEEGATRVGTGSRLDLQYAKKSPSGWLHADAFIHANGKRQLIFYIGGKHRP